MVALLLKLDKNDGRAQDVAGIEESDTNTSAELKRLAIGCRPSETLKRIQCIEDRIERCRQLVISAPPGGDARTISGIFLLQMSGIEEHNSRQFLRSCRGNDLTAKSSLGEQRQSPAMVKMGMGQQDVINAGWIETKWV